MKKFTRGFTLIELLVVIAIIGILASIVLVSLNGARKKGADARIISDVQETRTALETGYNGSAYADLNGANANCTTINLTNSTAANCVLSTGPDNANITTLSADAVAQNGHLYIVTNASANAYAIRGQLSSNTNGDFCIDSTGKTDAAEVFNNVANAGTIGCN